MMPRVVAKKPLIRYLPPPLFCRSDFTSPAQPEGN
jgi:hypothetical protein